MDQKKNSQWLQSPLARIWFITYIISFMSKTLYNARHIGLIIDCKFANIWGTTIKYSGWEHVKDITTWGPVLLANKTYNQIVCLCAPTRLGQLNGQLLDIHPPMSPLYLQSQTEILRYTASKISLTVMLFPSNLPEEGVWTPEIEMWICKDQVQMDYSPLCSKSMSWCPQYRVTLTNHCDTYSRE